MTVKVICALVGLAGHLATVGSTAAQTTYPERPIRIIVPYPAGGSVDLLGRLLGQKFTEAWGKPVVIENAPGASGNIGAERVAKATPDGHTLGWMGQGQVVSNPNLYKLPYDPVKDFAPISQVYSSATLLVVHNTLPAKSVKELVALAKAQPGALSFASGGTGSAAHLAAELFKSAASVDLLHIPYKGVVAAIPDLIGGRVTMSFFPIAAVLPVVREGKLRALAVTSLKRTPTLPELPTISESGYPGFEATLWTGLLAPARTPPMIIRKVHLETVRAFAMPDLRAKLADLGLEAISNSPEEFAGVIKSEIPKWAKVIKEAGIKLE
jgi:tripartite-type tricarboxylate transporter receptor subunit TctC